MKKGTNWGLVGIIAGVIIVGMFYFSTVSSLTKADNKVEKLESNFKLQIERRYELIPNLVNTVKGYANHEEEVFTQIAEARSKLGTVIENNGTLQEYDEANSALPDITASFLKIAENYPKLESDKMFVSLMDQLEGTQNRITVAKEDYNDAVEDYNNKVSIPPSSWIAGMRGFEEKDYLEVDENKMENPTVDFSDIGQNK